MTLLHMVELGALALSVGAAVFMAALFLPAMTQDEGDDWRGI
ncbi:hypothetical protein [uncultured Enterovirga sp.]